MIVVPTSIRHPLFLLAATVLVWGYNWVPLKIAAVAIDPYWLSAWRVAGGAATLFVVLALSRRNAAPPRGRSYIGVGLAQVAGLVVFSTLALRFGGVATVTALIFTMPLWTAIFAYAILGERLSRARVLWLLLACAGIGCIASEMRTASDLIGGLCATAGGASWAFGNVLQRRAAYTIDSVRLVAWQQLAAAVPLIALAAFAGRVHAQITPGVIAAATFAAVVGSGIAWLWWGIVLRAVPANTVALGSFGIPVVAALSAWVQLGTPPAPLTAIGLTVVVAGLTGSVIAARESGSPANRSAAGARL